MCFETFLFMCFYLDLKFWSILHHWLIDLLYTFNHENHTVCYNGLIYLYILYVFLIQYVSGSWDGSLRVWNAFKPVARKKRLKMEEKRESIAGFSANNPNYLIEDDDLAWTQPHPSPSSHLPPPSLKNEKICEKISQISIRKVCSADLMAEMLGAAVIFKIVCYRYLYMRHEQFYVVSPQTLLDEQKRKHRRLVIQMGQTWQM